MPSDPQAPEFVITVPETLGMELAVKARARTTLGVLNQLITQAEQTLVIAAPFIQGERSLGSGSLLKALRGALQRGVAVDVVSTGESLQSIDAGDLRKYVRNRLRFFRAASNLNDERRLGSHAKFCLADRLHGYIGSANLTGPGLSQNLEMGLLIHGELVQQVAEFWAGLVRLGFFVEV